jgi:hypothetical protein
LETIRLRGRPKNRWQHEVREDGRIVGGEGWHEKIYFMFYLRFKVPCIILQYTVGP